MQPQHSKTHTVLLLVLVLMAGVIIGLLLDGSKTKTEMPVFTPVQNPVQVPVSTTEQPVPETKTETPVSKNYSNSYFSFDYYGNASVQTLPGTGNNTSYTVNESNGDFPDTVMFFNGPIPKEYNSCGIENIKMFNVQVKSTIINGKTFTYCDNTQGEPIRTYIYKKNNKNIVAYILTPITSTSQKPQGGYIDISSIEIK